MRHVTIAVLLVQGMAWAATPAAKPPPVPPPTDAQCPALPGVQAPFAFGPGEVLEFDLDALGAQAGKMDMRVLPIRDGKLPIEVNAQTNTFFSKVRRVKGTGTSHLHPKTLRPLRYVEDAVENEIRRTADVTFSPKERLVNLTYKVDSRTGQTKFRYANEGLDVAGAIYLFRQLPFKEGLPLCFDVYGIRRLWRLSGSVLGKEKITTPLGEFSAWHLSGMAVRLDDHSQRREVHVWISDDARRLPLAALGMIDLGAVRATLTAFSRPGDKKVRADGKQSLKW